MTAHEVREQQQCRSGLEQQREDDGGPVPVFVEPEQRAALADLEADNRADRQQDAADRC
jgi:hypothetical protein